MKNDYNRKYFIVTARFLIQTMAYIVRENVRCAVNKHISNERRRMIDFETRVRDGELFSVYIYNHAVSHGYVWSL